jgi:4'-phosphopantetheinyl transferase
MERLAMGLAGSLQDGEVHIWKMQLSSPKWDKFSSVLSADEYEKASRYRTPQLQKNYSRCRSALRQILSLYTNQEAAALNFRYGKFGKPELLEQPPHFNVSHSGDHALIAISRQLVGVDLEFTGKTNTDLAGLIDFVCHPMEIVALARLPEAEKSAMFYQLWTQKEAYCKILGVGLQQSLKALHFDATANPSVFQVCVEDNHQSAPFFVHNLTLLNGYAASVCLSLATASIDLFEA